ncbi:hypothetical protein K1719_015668 [Acacia pycnantha]|nr:hypothetical protein K1719_015668 [Acacia pycnantha]
MALVPAGKKSSVFPPSAEDDELLRRSSKKIKNDNNLGSSEEWPSLGPRGKEGKLPSISFADKLKGTSSTMLNGVNGLSDNMMDDDPISESESEQEDNEPVCRIVEDPDRNFPTFFFSEKMKKKLAKAWKNAVIVKLLGRSIGYKLLLSILQSMWAKKGVLSLINIGNGFFVVKFTNKDDCLQALTGGPWMVFDHYLTVRPWEPLFHSKRATINKAGKNEGSPENDGKNTQGQVLRVEAGVSMGNKTEEGSWKVVQKPNRKKRNEKDIQLESNHSQNRGSRFEILSVKDVGSKGVNLGENERVLLGAGGSEKASDEVMHANSFVPKAIEVLPSRGNKGSSLKKNQKKKNPVGEKGTVQGSRQVQKSVKCIREPVQKVAAAKEILCLPYEELQPGDEKEQVSTGVKSFAEHNPDQDKMEQDVFLEASQEIDSLGLFQGLPGKFWACKESNEPEDEVVEETPHDLIEGETKVEDKNRLQCLLSLGFDGMAFVPSVGRSGGLVAVWRSDRVDVAIDGLDRQFIHLKCSFDGGSPFFFTSIYSIPDQLHKQLLWNALEGYASVIDHPWVVMGDFNDIATAMEKSGGSGRVESRMRRFTDRLQRCRLSDLGSCGPKFTWKGPVSVGGCRIFERLDRALGISG